MRYFNFVTTSIRADIFLNATHHQIGVWFRLMAYCCEQENDGMIQGCSQWSDQKWMIVAQVTREDVRMESPLWRFVEALPGVLFVHEYPQSQQQVQRQNRQSGAIGGQRRSRAKIEAAKKNGLKGGRPKTQAKPNVKESKVIIGPFADDASVLEPEGESEFR